MAEGSRLESGQVSKPRGFESLRLRWLSRALSESRRVRDRSGKQVQRSGVTWLHHREMPTVECRDVVNFEAFGEGYDCAVGGAETQVRVLDDMFCCAAVVGTSQVQGSIADRG